MTVGEAREIMVATCKSLQQAGFELRTWQGAVVISTPLEDARTTYQETLIDLDDLSWKPKAGRGRKTAAGSTAADYKGEAP